MTPCIRDLLISPGKRGSNGQPTPSTRSSWPRDTTRIYSESWRQTSTAVESSPEPRNEPGSASAADICTKEWKPRKNVRPVSESRPTSSCWVKTGRDQPLASVGSLVPDASFLLAILDLLGRSCRSALSKRYERPGGLAGVNLPRPRNTLVMFQQFTPVGDPARHPADGKHHRIHIERYADGPQQTTAVEINVGVEVALNEVVVLERLFFQFQRHIEQRILLLQFFQHLIDPLFQNQRARIKVLVDPMPEPHEPVIIILVLGHVQIMADRLARSFDLFEHPYYRRIGATVQGAPGGADTSRHRAE